MGGAVSDAKRRGPPAGQPGSGPRLRVEVAILADGRVVFGDLPEALAEVACVLEGRDVGSPSAGDGVAAARGQDALGVVRRGDSD